MNKAATAGEIINRLKSKGFEAYLAGGCVRDRLRGVEPKDFDIATSATPDQIRATFPKTVPVGAAFGVILVIESETPFEVATFRSDGKYADGRRPGEVKFTNVEEDAKRRDFTVNGLYMDVESQKVLDFVGGAEDLKRKLIRTIGNPADRFLEDHLRMLRAIRFAVQLEFEIDPATLEAVKKHASLITKVSQERIRDELSKTITSGNPARGIRLLDETGLLKLILPEMELLKGVEQPMQYHPEGDVFIHTLLLMEKLSHPELELAMGALLHDIAKPQTFERAPDRIRFHGHDVLGAKMARDICKRLAFSNHQTDLIASLVQEHLRFKDAFQMRVSTLKRFLSLERMDLHLELHRIDCLSSHGDLKAYEFCKEKWKELQAEPPPPLRLVNGQDLLDLGLKAGPDFTTILRQVEDATLEGTVKTREDALRYLKENILKRK